MKYEFLASFFSGLISQLADKWLKNGDLSDMSSIPTIFIFISGIFLLWGMFGCFFKKKPTIKQRFKRKIAFLINDVLPTINNASHKAKLEKIRKNGNDILIGEKDDEELAVKFGYWVCKVATYIKIEINDETLASQFETIGPWTKEADKKYDNY